jgi:hypothetical protein
MTPERLTPDLIALVAGAVATWRLSAFIVDDPGPFHIMERIRNLFGITHDDGTVISWPDTFAGELLRCVRCISLWIAPIVYGLWLLAPPAVIVLAFWGAAAMIQSYTQRQ